MMRARADARIWPASRRGNAVYVALLLLLLVGGALYLSYRLDKWFAYDDEGGYLYAAWRITLGEAPYRDFLTPQLPAFLYPGALVLRLTDLSALAARVYALLLVLISGLLLTDIVRRLWGGAVSLLMLVLYLVNEQIFWAARFFRPEAPMLFWSILGLWLLVQGYPERRRWFLALSGVVFGLSMASKLFGALFIGGVGLFILAEGARTRDWRDMLSTGLWIAAPFLLIIGAVTGLFMAISPQFLYDVLGHHLMQGQGTPMREVLAKGMGLYRDFALRQPVFVLLALLGLGYSLRSEDASRHAFFWQVPTGIAFMFMTRGLQPRHLTYLAPSLAVGAGLALVTVAHWVSDRWRGWGTALAVLLVVAGVVGSAWPHLGYNAWVASWEEHHTEEWVEYIQSHTRPDEYVAADYPGINFFARRPTTPTMAGISRGAALSGQITGAHLIDEIEDYDVRLVLLNVAQGSHQLVNLQDYGAFKAYLQTRFHLVDRRLYDDRLLEIYGREDGWEGNVVSVDYGHLLELTGVQWIRAQDAPQGYVQAKLRFQALAAPAVDYRLTLSLVDEQGHSWGIGGKRLVDIDRETYWDERGLEQAVPVYTSHWPPFETTVQVFELPIPLGTPAGEYRVIARLHPEGGWAGLPILDKETQEGRGYDADLGTVTVLPAGPVGKDIVLPVPIQKAQPLAPGLTLAGHAPLAEAFRPGDELLIDLWWSAEAAMSDAYKVKLTLTSAESGIVATTVNWIGGPGYSTDQWATDAVVRGLYDLRLPHDLDTGEYALDAQVFDGTNALGSQSLGLISVSGRQREFDRPESDIITDVAFGNVIALIGYSDLTVDGSELQITLHWRAEQAMERSYTVFVHVLDREGQIVAQRDSQPVQGEYPTTAWLSNEYVADAYAIGLPEGAMEDGLSVAVGVYDGETGVRLSASAGNGLIAQDDRVVLGDVIAP